ncbi:MAG TPA: DNA mismatch repair protein MutS [Fimbriimonadaceae bacterium]|nr:DNA mismatch repair protein MutS [Fimbriimonadaceae bacterium]HRJ96748.1 DNA mismatch repair protein MutS [Fimbriimonadaceae bacterium]
MRAQTPMLRQYFQTKESHPGVLLAMRVGDFYEFYGEDAKTAADALQITLTGREDGENGRIAMAGVPYHSVEKYLARLVQAGHKVALCDQVEDPKTAKGLVRRAVTRVLTAGTLLEDSMLDSGLNNFLAAICVLDGRAGLATLDPSTGEFLVTEIEGERLEERLLQELARLRPAELLVDSKQSEVGKTAHAGLGLNVTEGEAPDAVRAVRSLVERFEVKNLAAYGCEDKPGAIVAASMILSYAERNGLALGHVDSLSTYSVDGFMTLDPATRRSLELTQNLSDGSRRHTLLSVLDEAVTAMGRRMLRRWIEQPLLEAEAIRARHDAVSRLVEASLVRGDLRDGLRRLADVERLVSRAAAGMASPVDLAALRVALEGLPFLANSLRSVSFGRLEALAGAVGDHSELASLLARALIVDPPHSIREGGFIREGYDVELDKLRALSRDGRQYIAALESREKERTGIGGLKVGYNSVFGYYLEVSKAHLSKVPEDYIRKQTTANAERYITAELKEHESAVLGAVDRSTQLESDLFVRLRARVAEHSRDLLQTARALAEVDVLAALAEVAVVRQYVRPAIVEEDVLVIEAARHPVVEAQAGTFVPNDVGMAPSGDKGARLIVLTGPNMSGKSTYLRQTALIVLMAQFGSFVPARLAKLGLCDRIFARIGAKDELALGQSTFMVEMVESANILNHASERSLVILDEIGRGTSTYDGLAIAWAMAEHLAGLGAKTMFATHYHQLNALADQVRGVANFRVSVQEFGDEIVWTHKVLPGGTDRSYGIHVARMAGVPHAVLRRAAEILADLEQVDRAPKAVRTSEQAMQLTLFEAAESPVVKELRDLDLDRMTPLEAMQALDELKRKAKS